MKQKTTQEMKELANWYASEMFPSGEYWNWGHWSLTKDGFNIKNEQGKIIENFVFDFKNNKYQKTQFKKIPGSTKLVKQKPQWFKIPQSFNMVAIVVPEFKYPELNKKKPGDKQFFVQLVVDGYIDPVDNYDSDDEYDDLDYDDDHDYDNSYQKIEIYSLWAPNRKTVDKWADDKDFKDKEGNDGWICGIISKQELTPIKSKDINHESR